MRRWLVSLLAAPLFCQEALPKFQSRTELDAFLLTDNEERMMEAMKVLFPLDSAGQFVSLVVRYGPAATSKAASMVAGAEFQQSYKELTKYLDEFGACQKKSAGNQQGWWSNYGEPPEDSICSELTKILLGVALWNQIHYCHQLTLGEVKGPAAPLPGRTPPFRLDEPPVKTHWVKADVLYGLTDTAIELKLLDALRGRKSSESERVNRAVSDLMALLDTEKPVRELVALSLAKLALRNYQAMHLAHLATKRVKP
jgi:hypothetical protein